ncbi:MAG: hypothetical protein IT495_17415 [Gammaproteobacteria bacterium]|nr:hypothetical protein [Gammaproteobacteria bacterium]
MRYALHLPAPLAPHARARSARARSARARGARGSAASRAGEIALAALAVPAAAVDPFTPLERLVSLGCFERLVDGFQITEMRADVNGDSHPDWLAAVSPTQGRRTHAKRVLAAGSGKGSFKPLAESQPFPYASSPGNTWIEDALVLGRNRFDVQFNDQGVLVPDRISVDRSCTDFEE